MRRRKPEDRTERQCLSRESSGHTRQRHCLGREGSEHTRQMQCLSRGSSGRTRQRQCLGRGGSGNHKAKAVPYRAARTRHAVRAVGRAEAAATATASLANEGRENHTISTVETQRKAGKNILTPWKRNDSHETAKCCCVLTTQSSRPRSAPRSSQRRSRRLLKDHKQRRCLSREGSGNARQRRRRKGSGNTQGKGAVIPIGPAAPPPAQLAGSCPL